MSLGIILYCFSMIDRRHLFILFIIEEYTVSLGTVFVQICLGQYDNYAVIESTLRFLTKH